MRVPHAIFVILPLSLMLLPPAGPACAGRPRFESPSDPPPVRRTHPRGRRTPAPIAPVSAERDSVRFAVPFGRPTDLEAGEVLRTSVVAYQHTEVFDFMWEKLLEEQRVGTVLLEPKWDVILPSTDMQDLKRRMTGLDKVVTDVVRAGGSVLLGFQGVPRWISSQPRNNGLLLGNQHEKIWYSVPPKNYDEWGRVVQAFVQHFNKDLDTRGRVAYMIGSEPENYWKGTEEELFKYYQYAVRGALAADPDAKIGGITPSHHLHDKFNTTGKTTAGGRPLLQNWIRFCRANDVPIHFVTWHSFSAGSPVPSRSTIWNQAKRDIETWLRESGYRDTRLVLTDWPEWKPHPENDGEMKAAWAASGMISLLEGGLTRVVYLGLRDTAVDKEAAARRASFGGGNGLFTRVGIIKPVYNAFRLMSHMKGRVVLVDTQDDFVEAVASRDGDRLWILLSNFIPPDWLLPRNLFRPETRVPDDESLTPEMKKRIQNLAAQAVSGRLDVSSVKLDPEVKTWLADLKAFSARARARRGQEMQVSFEIQGMGQRAWQADEYVIDGRHANAFAHLDQILAQVRPLLARGKPDPQAVRKVVEGINARVDVMARDSGRRGIGLEAGAAPVFTTRMAPNAVHLVVVTPQDR